MEGIFTALSPMLQNPSTLQMLAEKAFDALDTSDTGVIEASTLTTTVTTLASTIGAPPPSQDMINKALGAIGVTDGTITKETFKSLIAKVLPHDTAATPPSPAPVVVDAAAPVPVAAAAVAATPAPAAVAAAPAPAAAPAAAAPAVAPTSEVDLLKVGESLVGGLFTSGDTPAADGQAPTAQSELLKAGESLLGGLFSSHATPAAPAAPPAQ